MMRKQRNGEWGTPINLGYPINTIDNEGSMVVASNGMTAYYASDRSDSRGLLDLYKFELRKDIRPIRTLYVRGQVRDAKLGNGLPSAVELIDQESGQAYFTLQTDETGRYFTPLPIGKDYTFVVRRKGYLFFSKSYELSGVPADSTYQLDILLQPIQKAEKLVLRDIRFKTGSAILEGNGQVELNKLVQWMAENAELKILITGHTDNIGKPSDNLLLSKQRAKAVMDYLIEKGIAANRIQTTGKGDNDPVASNQTEEGRAQNRRTEILILD
jgi:outer membrane protein OmpA-like peptidoglycan-associated protein